MKNKPQLVMFDKMLQTIVQEEQLPPDKAFLTLIDFLSYRFITEGFRPSPWLKQKTYHALSELLDVELLLSHRWDWIGELHTIHDLQLIESEYAVSLEEAVKSAEEAYNALKDIAYSVMLDPIAGTGRNVLAISERLPNTIFYLCEPDLLAYRMTLLNMAIYNIRACVLCCEHEKYDINIRSVNWCYANRWDPAPNAKLFTVEELQQLK